MIDTNDMRSKGDLSLLEIHALCDEIDRLRAGKPKPQGKTVRVKVAVAVDKNGKWNSCGWSNGEEKDVCDLAVEPVDEGESLYWLTADLPIPEEQTVEAEVENA